MSIQYKEKKKGRAFTKTIPVGVEKMTGVCLMADGLVRVTEPWTSNYYIL